MEQALAVVQAEALQGDAGPGGHHVLNVGRGDKGDGGAVVCGANQPRLELQLPLPQKLRLLVQVALPGRRLQRRW